MPADLERFSRKKTVCCHAEYTFSTLLFEELRCLHYGNTRVSNIVVYYAIPVLKNSDLTLSLYLEFTNPYALANDRTQMKITIRHRKRADVFN